MKNNLQIINSLLHLQSRYIEDKRALELFNECRNRIRSMALVHEKLYGSKDLSRIDFRGYIKSLTSDLTRAYRIDTGRIQCDVRVKHVSLPIDLAVPCGLIINELVSNALKYAFPSSGEEKGRIQVLFQSMGDDEVELVVSDNGVGLPETMDFQKTESLGLRLVQILGEDQLGGKVRVERRRGTKFTITFKGVK